MESLAQSHPFVDGNKRTAFAATYTFLTINGVELRAPADKIYTFIAKLYEDEFISLRHACEMASSEYLPTTRLRFQSVQSAGNVTSAEISGQP